jgi:hypothetical protein
MAIQIVDPFMTDERFGGKAKAASSPGGLRNENYAEAWIPPQIISPCVRGVVLSGANQCLTVYSLRC